MKKIFKMRASPILFSLLLILIWILDRFSKKLAYIFISHNFSFNFSFLFPRLNLNWGNSKIELLVLFILELFFIFLTIKNFVLKKWPPFFFSGLVMLGGLSNFQDWFTWGGVIDFIKIFGLVFNLADIMILAGLLGLTLTWVRQRH